MSHSSGWFGVDLDGTLAHYDEWKGHEHIGAPIKPMIDMVKYWIKEGQPVKIFTARVHNKDPEVKRHIEEWCLKHVGQVLPVTNEKDYGMIMLYDDRCTQVETNTGRLVQYEN